jgi:putative hydrolase of the HAD superfamily
MLVLFDIDDTLLDHTAAERSAAAILHRSIGAPVSLEQFHVRWARALEHHFARYLSGQLSYQGQRRDRVRDAVDSSLTDEAADRIFAMYLAGYEASWSLFSDVLLCLDNLSQHRLGVISNGQGHQQRKKLAQTGILDRFDCLLISEECGCAKPEPTIFLRACTQAGESPANAFYVGDRYDIDAQAARTAGLRGIWLDRNQKATADHEAPIIRSLDQLPALLVGAEMLPNHALRPTPASRPRLNGSIRLGGPKRNGQKKTKW